MSDRKRSQGTPPSTTLEPIVKALQDVLRLQLLLEESRGTTDDRIELLVVPPGPIKVSIYQERGGRHHRPHLHVKFADTCDGSFSIVPPALLAGDCRSAFATSVLKWVATNQKALLSAWSSIQQGKHPPKIEIGLD